MFKPEDLENVTLEPFKAENLRQEFCKNWNDGKGLTALAPQIKNPFLRMACHFLVLVGNKLQSKHCGVPHDTTEP
jgi:hypothetical protein